LSFVSCDVGKSKSRGGGQFVVVYAWE